VEAKAISRYVRISPRKACQAADLIRGKAVEEAFDILHFTPKKAARLVERTLRSAVANAINNEEASVDEEDLHVKEVYVNGAIAYKRLRPQPRGAAAFIRKRCSHITLIVSDVN
jgi:large subunit ribosomal protein L22